MGVAAQIGGNVSEILELVIPRDAKTAELLYTIINHLREQSKTHTALAKSNADLWDEVKRLRSRVYGLESKDE